MFFEKSHGQRSLTSYSLEGCKESDTTERLSRYAWVRSRLSSGLRDVTSQISAVGFEGFLNFSDTVKERHMDWVILQLASLIFFWVGSFCFHLQRQSVLFEGFKKTLICPLYRLH